MLTKLHHQYCGGPRIPPRECATRWLPPSAGWAESIFPFLTLEVPSHEVPFPFTKSTAFSPADGEKTIIRIPSRMPS